MFSGLLTLDLRYVQLREVALNSRDVLLESLELLIIAIIG